MNRPLRLDSIGVAGIGWDTLMWLLVVTSAGVALWMGWQGGGAPRFLLGLAAALATAFLLGSQAFLNYSFFVGAIAIVAVATDDHLSADAPTSDSEHADRRPTVREPRGVLG